MEWQSAFFLLLLREEHGVDGSTNLMYIYINLLFINQRESEIGSEVNWNRLKRYQRRKRIDSLVNYKHSVIWIVKEKHSPNHDASSFVSAIGSVWLVSDWNVIAGNPKPMPDDKFDTLARTLMRICNAIENPNEKSRWFDPPSPRLTATSIVFHWPSAARSTKFR